MVPKSNEATLMRPLGNRIVDAPFVISDITSLLEQIEKEKSWKKNDRNAITVFKTEGITTVLIGLHKGAEMSEHVTEGLVNIQILKGKIKFNSGKESISLGKGQVLTLHKGIPHSIVAKKKTFFLLTITTGPKEKNPLVF